jgi:AraC-like DNA-binding protein
VAYSLGFNDLSYFTHAFKRQRGVCPSDYKARARLS